MFTVLVCGGRDYTDIDKLYCALDSVVDKNGLWHPDYPNNCVNQELLIVSGGARGADSHATDWAEMRGVRFNVYLPNWSKYGSVRAAAIRNDYILQSEKIDLVVAFGGDANSEDLVRRAEKAKIMVIRIK